MLDFFGQTICIGDRVAFITNRGLLQGGQVISFRGDDTGDWRWAKIMTDGNRETEKRRPEIVKEP